MLSLMCYILYDSEKYSERDLKFWLISVIPFDVLIIFGFIGSIIMNLK